MHPEETVLVFIPSLVATLLHAEREKGAPLARSEVLRIRDEAPVVAMHPSDLPAFEEQRGYRDIDPECCWEQWEQAREELAGDVSGSSDWSDDHLAPNVTASEDRPARVERLQGDTRGETKLNWPAWILLDLLLPWIAPLVTLWFSSRRNDLAEILGVLAWPGIFLAVGAYVISSSERRLAALDPTRNSFRGYGQLARTALALLTAFEAAIVVTVSIWRWNPHERDVAIVFFSACGVLFASYAVTSLFSRKAYSRAIAVATEW